MGFLLSFMHLFRQFFALLRQHVRIDHNTVTFHTRNDAQQRNLDSRIDLPQSRFAGQFRPERLV